MVNTRKKRILHVEDDQSLARLVQKQLERAGYDVDLAFDSEQGLKQFPSASYDVLIVDQTLPEGNGLDLFRKIAELGPLPVGIMVTGTGNETIAVQAMKMGLSEYLVKDMEGGFLKLLPIVIENALHQRRLSDEGIRLERELALRSRIAEIFLTSTEKEMYGAVLNVLVGAVQSKYGVFSFLDEDGAAVLAVYRAKPGQTVCGGLHCCKKSLSLQRSCSPFRLPANRSSEASLCLLFFKIK